MMRSPTLSSPRTLPVWLAALLAMLAAVTASPAAKVKVWHHHATAQHDKAQFQQTVVSSEGALRLSRQFKPLANLDATHVWDVVEDNEALQLIKGIADPQEAAKKLMDTALEKGSTDNITCVVIHL